VIKRDLRQLGIDDDGRYKAAQAGDIKLVVCKRASVMLKEAAVPKNEKTTLPTHQLWTESKIEQ
jgi:hypothetical protein